MTNHPVHILNKDGGLSPSSFIPFCSFGEEFIGKKIDYFDIPICSIFNPKHYFDQLCYETDLHKLKDNDKIEKQLEKGFTLVLDYNEDREIGCEESQQGIHNLKTIYSNENDKTSFSMFVNTISTVNNNLEMFACIKIFNQIPLSFKKKANTTLTI